MKKIISFAIIAIMINAIMALPASAVTENAQVEISYVDSAPSLDGVVQPGEYKMVINSSKVDTDEFIFALDEDKSVDSDFYMVWDDESLYMAWVVRADEHFPVATDVDYNNDGVTGDAADLGHMWKYSCVQFMLCTGAPNKDEAKYQTGQWSGDYLEVGLSILANSESYKVAWSKPLSGQNLTTDDWDFVGKRDQEKKTTTYEVRIDWNKSGITQVGNGVQFGLTYAVSDQENYDNEKSMLEWQDAILDGKKMDAGAVITLKGKSDDSKTDISQKTDVLTPGNFEVPDDATEIEIDAIRAAIAPKNDPAILSTIIVETETISSKNVKDTLNILLKPVDGEEDTFEIASSEQASGTIPTFDDFEDGDIIIAFDATSTSLENASKLAVGDKLVFKGFDLAEGEYANSDALVYVLRDLAADVSDTSSEVSNESSNEDSKEDSKDTSSKPEVKEDSSEDVPNGDNKTLWIIIVVVAVLVIGAAVYFLVIKKKKQ